MRSTPRNWIFATISAITILYVLFCFKYIWPIWVDWQPKGPSEIGTLLQGVFAPIGFLWVIAAVALQIEQLKMNHLEFLDNRKVMVAQAEESKKQAEQAERQAEYIKSQTEILVEQYEQQRRDLATAKAQMLRASLIDVLQKQLTYFRWSSMEDVTQWASFQFQVSEQEAANLDNFAQQMEHATLIKADSKPHLLQVHTLFTIGLEFLKIYPALSFAEQSMSPTAAMYRASRAVVDYVEKIFPVLIK